MDASKVKIIDCTLRDGGYYTNWDFDDQLVDTYLAGFNHLPVDYLEVGYRSKPLKGYLGKFFYCPEHVLKQIRISSSTKIAVILNEKDVAAADAHPLLSPVRPYVDMVRLAVDPKNFQRALGLAEAIKKLGFEVAFNVMYMSSWAERKAFLDQLKEVDAVADYFYMVDSYGGVFPDDVRNIVDMVRSRTNTKLGFHGHNNLELALINTLTAIDCGVEVVDATVTGMGRGAGNLKTELLLTALNAQGKIEFDFNPLSKVVDAFSKLQEEHKWGTNLPYMVSGANSLPQGEVMDWVGKRYYSFNSIIRALDNQSKGVQDNQRLPVFTAANSDARHNNKVLIVGGGPSTVQHAAGIKKYLDAHPDIVVIHASSKNAMTFRTVANRQIFCLVGNEGHRMEDVFSGDIPPTAICVLPPFPRKMGTYIPEVLRDRAFELGSSAFAEQYADSHTCIALQIVLELGITDVEVVGYDGYAGQSMGAKEQALYTENQNIFAKAQELGLSCQSLTPTSYTKMIQGSIYSKL
jgi:4-hydroxy 2-oxovalerate aldolase